MFSNMENTFLEMNTIFFIHVAIKVQCGGQEWFESRKQIVLQIGQKQP